MSVRRPCSPGDASPGGEQGGGAGAESTEGSLLACEESLATSTSPWLSPVPLLSVNPGHSAELPGPSASTEAAHPSACLFPLITKNSFHEGASARDGGAGVP